MRGNGRYRAAGNVKYKKQKTSTPLPGPVQPTDIAGDSEGLLPEPSAHNHDTVKDIPLVSPLQILTDDVKREIEIGTESAVHQRVPVPKIFHDLYRMFDSTFVKKEERQQKGIPTL